MAKDPKVTGDKGVEMLEKFAIKTGVLSRRAIETLRRGSAGEHLPQSMIALSLDHSTPAESFMVGLREARVNMGSVISELQDVLETVPNSKVPMEGLVLAVRTAEGLQYGQISGELSRDQVKSLVRLALLPRTTDALTVMLSDKKLNINKTGPLKTSLVTILTVFDDSGIENSLRRDIGTLINQAERPVLRG